MLLQVYLNLWLDLRKAGLAPSTEVGYARLIRKYIPSDLQLDTLSPISVLSVLSVPIKAGYGRTAQLLLVLLRSALNDAVSMGLLEKNPSQSIKAPKHQREDPKLWSPEEMSAFLAAQKESPLYAVWLLALCCGLRRGELLGLRWKDINFSSGEIHIVNQRMRVAGEIIDKPPKSASGRRSLIAPAPVLAALRRCRAAGGAWSPYVCNLSPEQLARALRAAQDAAGLSHITIHGLRHSMATASVSLGVNPKILQGILGHAHYQTTADFYCHRDTRAERDALALLAVSL